MTVADKYLQVHGLFSNLSFEKFCSEIPEFYFKKEVPEDVVQNFEIVERLLAFSYYEYKLIDEAYAKAIHSFEMAMSIRYKELNLPLSNGKLVFDFLIRSLNEQNCFDTDITVLMQVKQMRNHFSHPERHSFGGAVYWNRVEFISRLVNEMYEDIALRIDRRKIAGEFIVRKQELDLDKFVVMRIGMAKPIILFNVALLWINNKRSPCTYLIEYTPLFDLTYETEGQIKGPEIFGLKIINPIFTAREFIATDFITGETVSFSSVTDNPEQINQFQNWKAKYDSISWNFMYEQSIRMWSSEILVPELQEFQKM